MVDTTLSDESPKILGVLATRTPASRGLQMPQKAREIQLITTIIVLIITLVVLHRPLATMGQAACEAPDLLEEALKPF
jgi:hypothetical protein